MTWLVHLRSPVNMTLIIKNRSSAWGCTLVFSVYDFTDPNNPILEGYCVEMVEELSNRMFFDYELILPTDKSMAYGKKVTIFTVYGILMLNLKIL